MSDSANQTEQQQPVSILKPLGASVLLYVAACALPALIFHNRYYRNNTLWEWQGYQTMSGLSLLGIGLVFGWMRLNFTAFANVALWLGWIAFLRRSFDAAQFFATAALLISCETLQLLVQPIWYDEGASVKGYLAGPHAGFLCWVASMVVVWVASHRARKGAVLRRRSVELGRDQR